MSLHDIHSILIVDDDPDDSDLFCETVGDINPFINCMVAANGQDALLFLKKSTLLPDVIFLDINMPRMNGEECLKELKKNSLFQHIPVVIYTGSKMKEEVLQVMRLGAFNFITKPVKVRDIRSEIVRALESITAAV
jgi:CheY-like chemotaxis protein